MSSTTSEPLPFVTARTCSRRLSRRLSRERAITASAPALRTRYAFCAEETPASTFAQVPCRVAGPRSRPRPSHPAEPGRTRAAAQASGSDRLRAPRRLACLSPCGRRPARSGRLERAPTHCNEPVLAGPDLDIRARDRPAPPQDPADRRQRDSRGRTHIVHPQVDRRRHAPGLHRDGACAVRSTSAASTPP